MMLESRVASYESWNEFTFVADKDEGPHEAGRSLSKPISRILSLNGHLSLPYSALAVPKNAAAYKAGVSFIRSTASEERIPRWRYPYVFHSLRATWISASSFNDPVCSCTRWGLPSRHVTVTLVRSYRTVSPLPSAHLPEDPGPCEPFSRPVG